MALPIARNDGHGTPVVTERRVVRPNGAMAYCHRMVGQFVGRVAELETIARAIEAASRGLTQLR